ncbi:MAG: putative Ig domain-containing protein [Deltaproteobacteria bacterium]|nr:putative Ig domain-containing protein [Deltaproteobacteria bacterium]
MNKRSLTPALLAATLVQAWAAQEASAQSYTLSSTSRTFSSIISLGTSAGFSASTDDSAVSISLPFSFSFFGTSYPAGTIIYATTNGLVNFDGDTEYTNSAIPTSAAPNGFLAPFWMDLTTGNGNVYYYSQGSGASASLTIEWSNVVERSTTYPFSFQAILYANGNIEFVYGSYTNGAGGAATIGVEDPTGFSGVGTACASSCYWGGDVYANLVMTFTPNNNPPQGVDLVASSVSPPQSSWTENSTVNFDVVVANQGTSAATGSYVSLYIGSSPTVTTSDLLFAETYVSAVSAGSTSQAAFSFTVPSGYAGTWYYAVIADRYNDVLETNENNNTLQAGVITISGGASSITITTTSLPAASVGVNYNQQLLQSGATAPYWYVYSGNLPQGLSLSSSGVISGVPSVAGTASFTVYCEQSPLTPGSVNLSLTVNQGGGTITISPATLPEAVVGVPFDVQLSASGGTGPYAFQVISGAPSWMTPNSSGQLTGTPTEAGSHTLMISVFDSIGGNVTTSYPLVVTAPTSLMVAPTVPAGVTGRPYSARVVMGGIPPYTVAVSGTLPAGLTFDASGNLVGTPTAQGQATVALLVTDSNTPQATVQGNLTITVTQLMPLAIASNDVTIYVKTDATATLEARGGVPPYRWALIEGALPVGFLFNPEEGKITGRVETTSTSSITVAVTDSEGTRAEKQILVKVQVFRAPNNGDRGDSRGGGCGCAAVPGQREHTGVLGVLLLGLLFGLRRRRKA